MRTVRCSVQPPLDQETDTPPPPHEQNQRQVWKYYLSATTVADGKTWGLVILCRSNSIGLIPQNTWHTHISNVVPLRSSREISARNENCDFNAGSATRCWYAFLLWHTTMSFPIIGEWERLITSVLLPPANEFWYKVIFSQASVILFTGGCAWWGHAWQGAWVLVSSMCGRGCVWQEGMHGRGVYMVAGGHAWQEGVCGRGAYMVGGGMCGRGRMRGRRKGHCMAGRYASSWNAFLFTNVSLP